MSQKLCVDCGSAGVKLRLVGNQVADVPLGESSHKFSHPSFGRVTLDLLLTETRRGRILRGVASGQQCEGGIQLLLPELNVGTMASNYEQTVADVISYVLQAMQGGAVRRRGPQSMTRGPVSPGQ